MPETLEKPAQEVEVETLTCNQMITLLEIFRGTLITSRRMGTRDIDIANLLRLGLIEETLKIPNYRTEYGCTQEAHDYFGRIQIV